MEKRDPLKEVTNKGSNIEPQGAVDNASKPSEAEVTQPSENKENGFFPKAEIDVSECAASTGEQKIVKGAILENDLCELFNNLQVETPKKSQEVLEEKSKPELDTRNKEIKKEEPVVTSPSLQLVEVQSTSKFEDPTRQLFPTEEYKSPSKQDADFLNELQSASGVYAKLEDTLTEKHEHVKEPTGKEFSGSPQKVLESDSELKSSAFFEKVSEPESEAELKKHGESLELRQESDEKAESDFEEKRETFQTQLPLDVETSHLGLICKSEVDQNPFGSAEIEQKQLGPGSKFEVELEIPEEKLDVVCPVKFQSGEIEQKKFCSEFVKEIEKLEEKLHSECEVTFQPDQGNKQLQSDEIEQKQSGPEFEKEIKNLEEELGCDCEVICQPDQENKQLHSSEIEQKQSGSEFEKESEKLEEKLDSAYQGNKQLHSSEIEQKQSGSEFEKESEKLEEKLDSAYQGNKQLQSSEIQQKQSGPEFEKEIEKPVEKLDSECEVNFQPDQENNQLQSGEIKQKQSEPEFEKEIEKPEEKLDSDCEVNFQSYQENKQLQSGETEQGQSGSEFEKEIEKLEEKSNPDCEVTLQPYQENKQLQSGETEQGQSGSEFEKEIEKPEENLDFTVKLQPDQENTHLPIHSLSNGEAEFDTEQKPENLSCEVEDSKTDAAEIEFCEADISNIKEKITEHRAKTATVTEVIPDNKTEESGDITTQTQATTDENSKVVTDAEITYIHQDDEHHLDSGVDSIEESYTKSPKSPVDFEESERGQKQDITSEQEVSDLPGKKLDLTYEAIEESLDQITSDEESKIDDSVRDELSQLVDQSAKPRTEEIKLVKEPDEPEEGGTIVINLTDNQKPHLQSSVDVDSLKAKMADLSEKLSEQQQENSDLKLQLNAIQQAKASLELEIRQKEEIIIKTQAEALKNEQTFKQEIKQLREKLKENSKLIEKDGSKELEDQLKEAKVREAKAVAELNQKTREELNYQKILEEYENTIATRFTDYKKLKEEHETATRHLANIELAFSDVHQKYERAKALLEGFKANEETLKLTLQAYEKTGKQHEERYESLKAHATGQLEKSNKEIFTLRDKYEVDVGKLRAIIKRLEIKCSSLQVSLQQKTEECAALSALCDEVTGKKV